MFVCVCVYICVLCGEHANKNTVACVGGVCMLKLVLGRMFEYSVYSNVSLIFECILKLRIFVTIIICILYTYFYI